EVHHDLLDLCPICVECPQSVFEIGRDRHGGTYEDPQEFVESLHDGVEVDIAHRQWNTTACVQELACQPLRASGGGDDGVDILSPDIAIGQRLTKLVGVCAD